MPVDRVIQAARSRAHQKQRVGGGRQLSLFTVQSNRAGEAEVVIPCPAKILSYTCYNPLQEQIKVKVEPLEDVFGLDPGVNFQTSKLFLHPATLTTLSWDPPCLLTFNLLLEIA